MDTPFLGLHPRIIPTGIASLFRRDEAATQKQQQDQLAPQTAPPAPEPSQSAPPPPEPPLAAPPVPVPEAPQASSAPEIPHETPVSTLKTDAAAPALSTPDLGPPSRPRTPSDPPPPYPHPSPPPSDPTFDPPFHNDVLLRDRSRLTSLAHFAQKHFAEGIVSAAGRHLLSHMEYAACLADYRELHARYTDIRELEDVDPLRNIEEWGPVRDEGPSFRAKAARVRFVNYYTAATGRPKKEKGRKEGPATGGASTPDIAGDLHEGSSAASMVSQDSSSQQTSTQAGHSPNPSSAASISSHNTASSTIYPSASPVPPAAPATSSRKEAFHSAYDQALKVSRRKLLKHGLKLLERRSAPSPHPDPDTSLYLSRPATTQDYQPQSTSADVPPAKMRKFCATPKKGAAVDGTWVSVPMRDIDEVDAHVSMFLDDGRHYGGLIADAGERIVGWVQEDATRRVTEMLVRGEM